MATEHILVDGYSILHQWTELRAARQRSLAAGRQALIHLLTQFHDCRGGSMTLVFDGRSLPRGGDGIRTNIHILYSKEGQTADAVIERIVGQSARPETFLVATDDFAEQNVVEAFGGRTISADAFHAMLESELDSLEHILDRIASKNRGFRSHRG